MSYPNDSYHSSRHHHHYQYSDNIPPPSPRSYYDRYRTHHPAAEQRQLHPFELRSREVAHPNSYGSYHQSTDCFPDYYPRYHRDRRSPPSFPLPPPPPLGPLSLAENRPPRSYRPYSPPPYTGRAGGRPTDACVSAAAARADLPVGTDRSPPRRRSSETRRSFAHTYRGYREPYLHFDDPHHRYYHHSGQSHHQHRYKQLHEEMLAASPPRQGAHNRRFWNEDRGRRDERSSDWSREQDRLIYDKETAPGDVFDYRRVVHKQVPERSSRKRNRHAYEDLGDVEDHEYDVNYRRDRVDPADDFASKRRYRAPSHSGDRSRSIGEEGNERSSERKQPLIRRRRHRDRQKLREEHRLRRRRYGGRHRQASYYSTSESSHDGAASVDDDPESGFAAPRANAVALPRREMPLDSNELAGVVSDDEEPAEYDAAAKDPGTKNQNHSYNHEKKSPPSLKDRSSSMHDDSVGRFLGSAGTILGDRYRVLRDVGLGTFGRVVECIDLKASAQDERGGWYRAVDRGYAATNNVDLYVAIKVVRKVRRYTDAAVIEANVVDEVNRKGGRGKTHVVNLHDAFFFQGHYCLVFESLGPSLYDFMKANQYKSFPICCVQDFAVQLLETLEFLHGMGLCHTDLKLENLLLVSDRQIYHSRQWIPESTRIKVIDFGGATYDHDTKSSIINTRQYRAPEVILGTGWSTPSDMWSAGCILAELYQGELLFPTHDNIEHLALMERCIGLFPRRMMDSARTRHSNGVYGRKSYAAPSPRETNSPRNLIETAFDSTGRHRMERVLSTDHCSFVRRSPRLTSIVRQPEDSWFLDLLQMILVIDPNERATASEALSFLSRIKRGTVRFG